MLDKEDTTASDLNFSSEVEEDTLSFVELADDNKTILINGRYSVKLSR